MCIEKYKQAKHELSHLRATHANIENMQMNNAPSHEYLMFDDLRRELDDKNLMVKAHETKIISLQLQIQVKSYFLSMNGPPNQKLTYKT